MPSTHPLLLLISGHPATGKSSFACAVQSRFSIPVFSKDGFKEILFDTTQLGGREVSQTLGRASVILLWSVAHQILGAGGALGVESNFAPAFARPEWEEVSEATGAQVIEVNLRCARKTLLSRFCAHWEQGNRHRGHADADVALELASRLETDPFAVLGLGVSLTVDTTSGDFEAAFSTALVALERWLPLR